MAALNVNRGNVLIVDDGDQHLYLQLMGPAVADHLHRTTRVSRRRERSLDEFLLPLLKPEDSEWAAGAVYGLLFMERYPLNRVDLLHDSGNVALSTILVLIRKNFGTRPVPVSCTRTPKCSLDVPPCMFGISAFVLL
jgi:hypothetical protein